MSTNTFQVLLLLMPTVALVIRLLLLRRTGWAVGAFVLCIVVGTLSGGYCEDCSIRAPGGGELIVGLIYAVATIYVFIKVPEWSRKSRAKR